jgi:hypothetical protein
MTWDRETRNLWRINKYLWMALGVVALYIPFAQMQGRLVIAPAGAWLLFGAGVGNVALRTYLGHRLAAPEKAVLKARTGWLLLFIDLVLLAFAIYSTKGLESDFWLLYLVIGIAESIHAPPVEARIVSALIALS